MAADRPPQRSQENGEPRDAEAPAAGARDEQAAGGDEGDVASYEVGAGVPEPGGDAARRPFLRAVLSDGTRTLLDEEGDREVVVHDRFARLDAGLPPLPAPSDDADAEDLSPKPFVHRPEAPPARPTAAGSAGEERSADERPGNEPSERDGAGDGAARASWQHLAPPPPRPVVVAEPPKVEEPAAPPAPAPPAVAATKIVPPPAPPRPPEPRNVVSFFAEDDEDDEPRSVDFEAAADRFTEPVTDRYAPSNAADEDDDRPAASRVTEAEPDDEDDDAPPSKPSPPWRRSIFRAFSG